MIKLLPFIQEGSGCDYHRLHLPLTVLMLDHPGAIGINKIEFRPDKTIEVDFEGAQIVIYNRLSKIPLDQLLKLKRKYGFKIIVDIDDYWEVYPGHILYPSYKHYDFVGRQIENLKMADLVVCTHSRLADQIRAYNVNIEIIPNTIPSGYEQFREGLKKPPTDKIRFIYTGGSSHEWDVRLLHNPFKRMLSDRIVQEKGEFQLAGYYNADRDTRCVWDRMEASFSVNGKLKGYQRLLSRPLDSYMGFYENADISLIPLEDRFFNHFKSNLKILEAGAKGLPVICSEVEPYKGEGCTGIKWVRTQSDWYKHIRFYLNNPQAITEDGAALYEHVRANYDMKAANEKRLQIFEYLANG